MEKIKKLSKRWLCISLIVMLLCSAAVFLIQTDMGTVSMKEMFLETDEGYGISAYLFVPREAARDNPAPAVVTSHGFLNNKEMQDANYVELARRGFVVLAIDQPDHGDSESIPGDYSDAVYQGALMLSRLPYVDRDRIGITGHSMGGGSCNKAILHDNENEEPIISAVLLNCADAMYKNDSGEFYNAYGSRDAAIVSAVYDEFFHQFKDENGVDRQAPYFMKHETAQSFLYFGTDPAGMEKRPSDVKFYDEIDGENAIRVIYRPAIIHPWSHFSGRSTKAVIDFFNEALEAPNPIPAGKQVWQWKEAFNCVGLLALCVFICSFGSLMLFTKPFESLRAQEIVQPRAVPNKKGKAWFWLSLIIGALLSMIIYIPACGAGALICFSGHASQGETLGLGLWSTLCGVVSILTMLLFYRRYGRKNGFDLKAEGVIMPKKKLWLSILLGIIIAVAAYMLVFAADYFFYADFRIWTLAIKAFELPILKRLPYVLLFVTYYVANSVAVNCFNYNGIGGKSWGNSLLVSFMTALPAIILPLAQYVHYAVTNSMLFGPPLAMFVLWLFPIILILFFSTLISRWLYRVSKNPYIAGTANALIIGILTITNTCTMVF